MFSLEYRDLDTGETRITRGGPEREFTRLQAVLDVPRGGNLEAIDTPAVESRDYGVAGTVTVDVAIVPGSMEDVAADVGRFNEQVNTEGYLYWPQTVNSNTYGGDAFEELTGREPRNQSNMTFPGLRGDLRHIRPLPGCRPRRGTNECNR